MKSPLPSPSLTFLLPLLALLLLAQPSNSVDLGDLPRPGDLLANLPSLPEIFNILSKLKTTLDIRLRPHVAIDVPTIVSRYKYPVETYTAITKDKYVLEMHRIPHGRDGKPQEGRPVVFIQHGLLTSSADFVIAGPGKALAMTLADNGYDVWMGNFRGNRYGRKHLWIRLDAWDRLDERKFWQFSWDEHGKLDLPAMMDLVMEKTGQDKMQFIGFGMGVTAFVVMSNELPEYADRVKMAHFMAPATYMKHVTTPLAQVGGRFVGQLEMVRDLFGLDELLPNEWLTHSFRSQFCKPEDRRFVCLNALYSVTGFDKPQMNMTILPWLTEHTPAGSSTRNLLHFLQSVGTDRLQAYDFGRSGNREKYGQDAPPEYRVDLVKVPVATYWGENDWVCSKQDYERTLSELPNLFDNYTVPYERWNHVDFLWAKDIDTLLHPRVLQNLAAGEQQFS